MKLLLTDGAVHILRFDKGEDVLVALKEFCIGKKIGAASFQALGAAKEIVLAYYDLKKKAYIDKNLAKDVEIASLIGNIARKDSEVAIHAHGSFSDETFATYSGHVKKLIVSATCEVTLTVLHGRLERKFDNETGLNLLL